MQKEIALQPDQTLVDTKCPFNYFPRDTAQFELWIDSIRVRHLQYRPLTPALRTDLENHRIFSLADVIFARRFFSMRNVTYWHLCGLSQNSLVPAAMVVAGAINHMNLKFLPVSILDWVFSFDMVKLIEK